MLLVDHTCVTAAENLAIDEVLLDEAEMAGEPREFLRLWEPARPMVVMGYASRAAEEVRLEVCRRREIPVLRRSSGGATIVAGPGCLMYAVVLSYQRQPELRGIDLAHRFVLDRLRQAIDRVSPGVEFQGTSDLTWRGRKFSGNALRCRREHLLYHGTLLYDFPLALVEDCLGMPPRVPDYRAGRSHGEFIGNLPIDRDALRLAVLQAFPTQGEYTIWNRSAIARLVAEKFARDEWNLRL